MADVSVGPGPPAAPAATQAGAASPSEPEYGPRSRWLLVVCCVAQFMVILDLSIVNVALPSIQSALGFSSADLEWVGESYAVTFPGCLMQGGRVVYTLGQRRTFAIARRPFALTSLVGGAAKSRGMLIGARGLQ